MRLSSVVRKAMPTRHASVEFRTNVDTKLDVHATNFVRKPQEPRHARVKFRANADTKTRHGCVDFGTNADTSTTFAIRVSYGRRRKLGCDISTFLSLTRNVARTMLRENLTMVHAKSCILIQCLTSYDNR